MRARDGTNLVDALRAGRRAPISVAAHHPGRRHGVIVLHRAWIIALALPVTAFDPAIGQNSTLLAPLPTPPPVLAPPLTPPGPASTVTTARGPALVTGNPAAPRSVLIPGSPVPGTMFDNGNGTSTVVIPGGGSQVVPTPR